MARPVATLRPVSVDDEVRTTTRRDPLAPLRRRWEEHGWGAVEQMHAYGTLLRTRRLVLAVVDDALDQVGLTSSRHTLLMTLDCSPQRALTIGQLSRRTMSHPTSVTKLVDAVAADGLVEKVVPDYDRRSVVVHLTEKGVALLEAAAHVLSEVGFGLGALDEEQLTGLIRACDVVRQDLSDSE